MQHQCITYEQACELIERHNATEVATLGLAQVFMAQSAYIVIGSDSNDCFLIWRGLGFHGC